jgi:hypothetical protein
MRFELERLEKRKESIAVCWTQLIEAPFDLACFTSMSLNGVVERQGFKVVHKARLGSEPPEWNRTQLVRRILGPHLYDPIAGSDVM